MTSVGVVFDTFAWIEELDEGPHADDVLDVHIAYDVGTPSVVLAELAWLASRRTPEKLGLVLDRVRSTSTILDLTSEIAVAAGKTRADLATSRRGIGIVDCIVLETARAHRAAMVTGDPHLKDLEGVRWVGR